MATHATDAMDHSKLTALHWRVWFLSAMGIFLDGFDLFIIAVALPLLALQFSARPAMLGLVGAAAPLGCIIGATLFGRFTDHLGRKAILLIDLLFFVVFAGLSAAAWDIQSLIIFRFLLGIGIGADYPVSSTYITENMPTRFRGKMLVAGFGFQALGMIAGAILGIVVLKLYPNLSAWRFILGFAVIPAVIILFFRLSLPESPRWLIGKGKHEEAAQVASKMTGKKINIDAIKVASKSSFSDLFSRRYIGRTALTALSWFLMDVAFYGVALFTPIIMASFAISHNNDFSESALSAIYHSACTEIFLIIGVLLCILMIDHVGRIKLQTWGFFGMAIGMFILASASLFSAHSTQMLMIFSGFILFFLMLNAGPNPTTFLLPAELFPTHLRATGHGFASASGKVGAAVGIFILPVLKATLGLPITMSIMGVVALLGFLLTAALGFETKGKSLDDIQKIEYEMNAAEVSLLNVQDDIQRLGSDLKRVEGALHSALREIRRYQQPPR